MTVDNKSKVMVLDNKPVCNCGFHLYHESCDTSCPCMNPMLTTVFTVQKNG
jgi:hypothetical protein